VRALFLSLGVAALLAACGGTEDYVPRDGDLVFHTSRTAQSEAIRRATGSEYTHVGVVYVEDGRAFVFEAVEPVRSTPLEEWVGRGEGERFVAKRLRDADDVLTPAAVDRLRELGESYRGRPYDWVFAWSDSALYCSELVWKLYDRAVGVRIGEPGTLGDFDLSHPEVRRTIERRWPDGFPGEERAIAPSEMFASEELVTVYAN
jgi:uncharacterized protein YycO